jgi:signal transduction histidine kinase
MIENLLTLARLDAGQTPLPQEPIELCAMIVQAWRNCEPTATARGLTFHNEVPEDYRCAAERSALVIILSNLLENAVQYTNEGGEIWVTARCSQGGTELAVANSGCTLTGEQVNRVFDRFWRSDASREEASLHVGLGLSLVRRIAQSWEGTATAAVDRMGIFRVHVAWPSHRNPGRT